MPSELKGRRHRSWSNFELEIRVVSGCPKDRLIHELWVKLNSFLWRQIGPCDEAVSLLFFACLKKLVRARHMRWSWGFCLSEIINFVTEREQIFLLLKLRVCHVVRWSFVQILDQLFEVEVAILRCKFTHQDLLWLRVPIDRLHSADRSPVRHRLCEKHTAEEDQCWRNNLHKDSALISLVWVESPGDYSLQAIPERFIQIFLIVFQVELGAWQCNFFWLWQFVISLISSTLVWGLTFLFFQLLGSLVNHSSRVL